MAFVLASFMLAVFVVNVTMGAIGGDPFFGNVAEMLVRFGAATAFTAGTLQREAAANRRDARGRT